MADLRPDSQDDLRAVQLTDEMMAAKVNANRYPVQDARAVCGGGSEDAGWAVPASGYHYLEATALSDPWDDQWNDSQAVLWTGAMMVAMVDTYRYPAQGARVVCGGGSGGARWVVPSSECHHLMASVQADQWDDSRAAVWTVAMADTNRCPAQGARAVCGDGSEGAGLVVLAGGYLFQKMSHQTYLKMGQVNVLLPGHGMAAE